MSIQASRYDTRAPEAPRVLAWQDDVAKSIAESTSGEAQHVSPQTIPAASAPSGVVINNHIITTTAPPVVVTRYKAEGQKASDEISTRTFIGTVLGMYNLEGVCPCSDCISYHANIGGGRVFLLILCFASHIT